jgi:hypothetical protein
MYIYMKIGKRNGKREKEKKFPANWTGGEILAQRARASARPRGQADHSARQRGNGAGMARAHVPEGGEADNVKRGGEPIGLDRR